MMTQADRDIQRKLKILKHAEVTGHVGLTCRYFGLGRASFYRWKAALEKQGEGGSGLLPVPWTGTQANPAFRSNSIGLRYPSVECRRLGL